jgi:hypothetical protein
VARNACHSAAARTAGVEHDHGVEPGTIDRGVNPVLYNTPYDEGSLLEWSSVHQKDHFGIASQIMQKFSGTTVLLMPIDPVPLQLDMLTWAMNHQFMHNEMDNVVGVAGFDLSSVNFMQREQLLIWINLHAMEHFNVWQRLSGLPTGLPAVTPSGAPSTFAGA